MRLHRTWKRAISFLTSVVLTTVSIVPGISPLTAYAAGEQSGSVYFNTDPLVGLDEKTKDNENYFNTGTHTVEYTKKDSEEYYVKKQFDWKDEKKDEGFITFKLKLDENVGQTTAVYTFTPCMAHGFSKDIAKSNLDWLAANYDHVDVVWYTGEKAKYNKEYWNPLYENVHISTDVQKDSDGDGKPNYVDILDKDITEWETAGDHWGLSEYTGLYAYLAGLKDNEVIKLAPGADHVTPPGTLTMDTIKRKPTAIYTAFDGILDSRASCVSGIPFYYDPQTVAEASIHYPHINYDCWQVLYAYRKQGRYISSGKAGDRKDKDFLFGLAGKTEAALNATDNLHYEAWNILLALSDPSLFDVIDAEPDMDNIPTDQLWNGETRDSVHVSKGNGDYARFKSGYGSYKFDYSYAKTFAEQGAKAIGIELDDTMADPFDFDFVAADVEEEVEILPEEAKQNITTTVENGKIKFNIRQYQAGTELTFKVPVEVNEDKITEVGTWQDTNNAAELVVNLPDPSDPHAPPRVETTSITSPKAHLEGTSLNTDAEGAGLVKKQVNAEGTAWAGQSGKEFAFSITPGTATYADGTTGTSPYGKNANKQNVTTKSVTMTEAGESGQKEAGFGTFYFTKLGTYTYTVKEEIPTGTNDGWTYDRSDKTITIVVSKDAAGEMTAAVQGEAPVFENTYAAEGTLDTTQTVIAQKTVTAEGTAWAGQDGKAFTFTITPGTAEYSAGEPRTGTSPLGNNAAGEPVDEVTVKFTEAGTKTVDFGIITFNRAGTYEYTIQETNPKQNAEGWTYDNDAKSVKIKVTDNGKGTLTAVLDGEKAVARNKYETEPVVLDTSETAIAKKLVTADGTAWTGENGKTFEFSITAGTATYTSGDPAEGTSPLGKNSDGADVNSGSVTFKKTDEPFAYDKIIDFGKITFTRAGTYTYNIKETTKGTEGDGWTYDNTASKAVTVKVEDNGNGTLTATVTGNAPVFENKYEPIGHLDTGDDDTAVLKKTVDANGTAWASKTFNFTIEAVGGAPLATESDASGGEKDRTEGSATFDEAGTKTIDFGVITFKKAGTYTYKVKEVEPKEGDTTWEKGTNGWTFGLEEKTVTVDVTDDGKGTLTAVPTSAEIVNKYEPEGKLETDTEAGAVLKKTIEAEGTAWAPKTFDFTITPVDDAPLAKDGSGNDITSGSVTFETNSEKTQIVSFGTIKYTKIGDYKYKLQETTQSGSGWTCDNTEHEVTVSVTDPNGDGTLTATVNAPVEITNKYTPNGELNTSVDAVLTKTVETEEAYFTPAKVFTFKITAEEGSAEYTDGTTGTAPLDKPNGTATFNEGGTKTIDFGTIKYTKAGTYTYKVKETTQSGGGWTCDNNEYEVTVKVVDNGDGTLTATVEQPQNIVNKFEPSVDFNTKAKKVVAKKVTADNDSWAPKEFKFTITPESEGAPLALDANGDPITEGTATFTGPGTQYIDFGKIKFTQSGTYIYKVKEVEPKKEDTTWEEGTTGWTFDTAEHTFEVLVLLNGQSLVAIVQETAEIENKYGATGELVTSTNPIVRKVVRADGDAWGPKEFKFTITPGTGSPLALDEDGNEITEATLTFTEAGPQNIDFGTIVYTKAGSYSYTVVETDPSENGDGWECEFRERTVTVNVKDNGDGTLTATPSAKDITNVYKPTGTWDTFDDENAAVKKIVKTEEPETSLPQTFQFTITPGTAEYIDGTTGTSPLAKDRRGNDWTVGRSTFTAGDITDGSAEKAVDFGIITFTKAGTYHYEIVENTTLEGWETDNETKELIVTVTDNGDGTLTATAETPEIINEYKPEGDLDTSTDTGAVLKKTVTAEGTAWAPKTFNFTLATVSDAEEAPAEGTAGETAQAAPRTGMATFSQPQETQIISFGTLKYTKSGTYTYTLTETTESGEGWICDNEPKTVTVTVTDDGKGKLTAVVEGGAAQIENRYEPIGHLDTGDDDTAVLKKTVDANGTAWASKTFNFTIEAVGGAPLATESDASGGEKDRTEGSATFDEAGTKTIDFGVITFKKAGTYTYKVKETKPTWDGNGWTFDLAEKEVTVEVTDNGKGTLTASPTNAEIVNKYEPTGTDDTSTEAGAVLTKTVVTEHIADGTEWTPKTFDFEITAGTATYEDGKTTGTSPAPEKSTGSATFDKAGTQIIDFGKITFHRGGTYTYKVKETEPKWDTTGWTLDTTEHTVTIEATDNGDGTMTVKPVKTEIENKYSPEPAVLDGDTALKVRKALEGPAEIHEGQFSFTLASGSDAETVETVANDANGEAIFSRLEFTEVGTYEFKITEADTSTDYNYEDNPYITFDLDRVIEVTVEVTDSGKGYLEAEVTYDSEKATPTITNFYQNRTYDVLKYWDDADDRLETRSEELTLQITGTATVDGDEMVVYPYNDDQKNIATVSDATKWSYTFENLPKYYLGTEISYTVEETDAPEGFTLASKSDADPDDPDKTNVVLINRTDAGDLAIKKLMNVATKDEIDGEHGDTPYTFLVEVTKEDGEPLDVEAAFYTAYSKNYDETKTEGKITGTVNFKDGKAYVDGVEGITLKANEIIRIVGLPAGATYTVTEKEGENLYTPVVFGGEGTIRKDKVSYVNFINREITKDKLKVEKVWDDEDDYDGFRPKQVSFDIYRELDGEREDKPFTTVTLDDENSFTAFIDLDKELVATISDASKSEAVKNASASYADSAAGSKSTAASFSDASVSDAFGEDGELLDGSIFNDLISVVRDAAGKVAHLFGLDDDVKVTWTAEEKEVKKDDLKYYTADDAVYEQDDTGIWTVSITNKHELMNPVWIDPPVEKIIKIKRGTITTDETFTFRMTGMNGTDLFPKGTTVKKDSDGNYYIEVSVTGEGSEEFGKIEYDKAGTYKYKITEIDGGAKYYTYSKDYYEITVEVKVEDGRLKETVTLKKNGSETISTVTTEDGVPGSKLDIAFTNEYDRTGGGGSNTPGGGGPGGPGGRTPTPSTPADPGTPVIPEAPVPGALPKTGEPVGRAIPMLFAMLAMFGALFGFRKRDDEDE